MAFIGISTAFSSAAAMKGTIRIRPLRPGWRRGRSVELVCGAELLTEKSEIIGNVLPIHNLAV
jgi:hypothetical protein